MTFAAAVVASERRPLAAGPEIGLKFLGSVLWSSALTSTSA
jgi:hypothetical protein